LKNEELKELINLHTKVIRAEIKASGDITNLCIDSLSKKFDDNHKILDQVKKETTFVRLMYNHPKKTLFVAILIVFGFVFLLNNIELRDLLFFLKR